MDKWLTLKYWQSLGDISAFTTVGVGVLTAVATILSVAIAALLTYFFTRRHSRNSHNVQINVDLLKRRIDALEKLWKLLAYTSDWESDYTIFRWREKEGNKEKKDYYFHQGKLREFMRLRVSEMYHHEHVGLFLPDDIKDLLYKYTDELMGFYLLGEGEEITPENELVKIKNVYLYKKFEALDNDIRSAIKQELKNTYQELKVC